MISLKKENIPEILKKNGTEWTRKYMEFIDSKQEVPKSLKNKYSHPKIKAILLEETKGKCAYCESSFTATDYGHVEHIEPKSKVPKKIFSWRNLTLSCSKCNLNKDVYYNNKLPLLNPYIDKPEKELVFLGPLVSARSKRALMTIKKLELNRPELYERRMAHIDYIQSFIYAYATADEIELKEMLYDDLIKYTELDKEYVSMVRSIIKTIDSPVLAEGIS
ncbi:HNH endonuclease [Bacillus thuringiensis]|uniref:HNH endonuclease n=1 Tax=Bacillus thuringiensis TaxID=1428 RepID=UPI000BF92EC7|nr:HNH endonuclease [Bacillus thuringiensis]PFV48425.1 HNH endonuclease [Bacillus thuringiensis]